MASEGLRYPSGRFVLQERQRGFSCPVFDLLPAMASTVATLYTDRWSRHVRKAERDGDLYTSRERCSGRAREPQASPRHRTSSRLCSPYAPAHPTSPESTPPHLEDLCDSSSSPSRAS